VPMKMSHEEFVLSQQKLIGAFANKMLNGSIDYLEGAMEIAKLISLAELDKDENTQVFRLIDSETDSLPIGKYRKNWSAEALDKHGDELRSAQKWAQEISLNECKYLSEKYGT